MANTVSTKQQDPTTIGSLYSALPAPTTGADPNVVYAPDSFTRHPFGFGGRVHKDAHAARKAFEPKLRALLAQVQRTLADERTRGGLSLADLDRLQLVERWIVDLDDEIGKEARLVHEP